MLDLYMKMSLSVGKQFNCSMIVMMILLRFLGLIYWDLLVVATNWLIATFDQPSAIFGGHSRGLDGILNVDYRNRKLGSRAKHIAVWMTGCLCVD